MKVPWWLVVSLLAASVLGVVGHCAWLWFEMPRRTATKFVEALKSRQREGVNELLTNATCIDYSPDFWPERHFITIQLSNSDLSPAIMARVDFDFTPRSPLDLLIGEQRVVGRRRGRDIGLTFNATWKNVTVHPDEPRCRQEASRLRDDAFIFRSIHRLALRDNSWGGS